MRFLKYFLIVLAVVVVLVIGVLAWLFSASGNEFLKNKITQIVNEKAPLELKFDHFKLGFSSYAFGISDKMQSQVAISGDYSLFTLNTDAKINGVVKSLALYEKLIGMKLNGGVALNAIVSKKSSDLSIKGDINAFQSKVDADLKLENFKPKRLFVSSPKGIKLESLLYFLNQPKYASGLITLEADMDIEDINAPKGGFQIASQGIAPNLALLKKQYDVILPKDALKLAIKGDSKAEEIITSILLTSSYLNVASNNLRVNPKDFSTNGDIVSSLKNISASGFKLKENLGLNVKLSSKNIANQSANANLFLAKEEIKVITQIPNYSPKEVKLLANHLNIASLLRFASLPYEAKGKVSANVDAKNIDLAKKSFALNGNLKSEIDSLVFNKMKLMDKDKLNVDFSGDSKNLNVKLNSDLFDSNTQGAVVLSDFIPKNVEMNLKNLNLQKLSALLGYEILGNLNANAKLKDFDGANFTADFNIDSNRVYLSKKALNKLSGMDFKNDLEFVLKGNGNLKNGKGKTDINLDSKDLQVHISNANIDLKNESYFANFLVKTPNIARINPLSMKLKGPLELSGSGGISKKDLALNLTTPNFGQPIHIDFKKEKLDISASHLDLKKIATFMDSEKFIKGGALSLNSNLFIKGKDSKEIIKNLNGTIRANMNKIELYSIDIDGIANSYENINSINLLDIGAFAFAGPLGLAATKGKDASLLGFSSLVNNKTLIRELQADLDVKNGVVSAKDVAFATGKTRIAAIGGINLNNNTFDGLTLAILDKENCAKFSQKVKGTLDKPQIEITGSTIKTAVNLATSLLGKITSSAQKITKPIIDTQKPCKPFYHGVVKP